MCDATKIQHFEGKTHPFFVIPTKNIIFAFVYH